VSTITLGHYSRNCPNGAAQVAGATTETIQVQFDLTPDQIAENKVNKNRMKNKKRKESKTAKKSNAV
jgi:hypothetical protein